MRTMKPSRFACLVPGLFGLACHSAEPPATEPVASPAPAPVAAQSASPAPVPAAPTEEAAPSLAGFEGEIGLQWKAADSPKPAQSIVAQVKGGKLRFGMPEGVKQGPMFGERAYVVVDVSGKKLFAVVDPKRQVLTIDLETIGKQMEELRAGQPKPAEPSAPPKVDKTGRQDSVAGYACEEWDVTAADGHKSRICVAEQSASFLTLPTVSLPTEDAWARELFDGKHVPLRAITLDPAGNERTRLEVSKLEPKALPDALFAMPDGYKVIDFVQMMRGLGAAMAAMGQGPAGGAPPPGAPGTAGAPKMPPNMQAMMEQMNAARAKLGAKGGGEPPPEMKAMLDKMAARRAKATPTAKPEAPAAKP